MFEGQGGEPAQVVSEPFDRDLDALLKRVARGAVDALGTEAAVTAAHLLDLNSGAEILPSKEPLYEAMIPASLRERPMNPREVRRLYAAIVARFAATNADEERRSLTWAATKGPVRLSFETLRRLLAQDVKSASVATAIIGDLAWIVGAVEIRDLVLVEASSILTDAAMMQDAVAGQEGVHELDVVAQQLKMKIAAECAPSALREPMLLTDALRDESDAIIRSEVWRHLRTEIQSRGWTLADVIVADLVGDEADTAMTVGILGPDDQFVLIDADVETERIISWRAPSDAEESDWLAKTEAARLLRGRSWP